MGNGFILHMLVNQNPPSSLLNSILSYGLLVLGLLFVLYWGILNPPTGHYYTTDEQFIADSGVFMLYGLTPRCLDWPAIPAVFLFYLITLVHLGIDVLTHRPAVHGLADVFARADAIVAQYLTDRSAYLTAGRLVQLLLTGGLLAWLMRIINRTDSRIIPPATGLLLSFLLVLNPDLLTGTAVLRPEGLAYPLAMLLIGLILFGDFTSRWALFWGLLLTAVLISQRLIFVFMLPFWVGGLLLRAGQFSVRNLLLAGVGLVGLLFMVMPFLWTDTLVLAKAFAGGILVKVNAPGQTGGGFNWPYLAASVQMPDNWVYGLALIGGYSFLRQYPHRPVALLLIGVLVLYGVMVLRSAVIYPTHTLPLRCLSWPLVAYGGGSLYQWLAGRLAWPPLNARVGAGMLGGLVGLLFLRESIAYERLTHLPSNHEAVLGWLRTVPPTAAVLMASEFNSTVPKSRTCLQRELADIENPALFNLKMQRLLTYVGGRTGAENSVPVLLQMTLSEDEKAAIVQHRLLIQAADSLPTADTYFYSTAAGFISYYLPYDAALSNFRQGRYAYTVADQPIAGLKPGKIFDQGSGVVYYLYTRPL